MAELKRRSTAVSVAVVIPVRNDAENLRRCLQALMAQRTVAADEIIVVDGGSTDHSASVALSMGVRLIFAQLPGVAAAASAGYDEADCDIIARLDADSVPALDWVERIHRAFDRDPMLVAVTGGAHFIDGPRMLRRVGAAVYLSSYYLLVGAYLAHTPLFGSNCAFRRQDWREIRERFHRADTTIYDDIDLSLHLGPVRRIRLDRTVRVALPARPFAAPPSTQVVRWGRGIRSLVGHGHNERPWARLMRRWGARDVVVRPPAEAAVAVAVGARRPDTPPELAGRHRASNASKPTAIAAARRKSSRVS